MAQRILNVRVRPFRVAVLLAKAAPPDEVLLGLKFLSRLWGGRYCQLLAVEPSADDPSASFRLSLYRPDLVYGVGIDHAAWKARVAEACQPRLYRPLDAKYVDNLAESPEEHITVAHVAHRLRQTPAVPGSRGRTLRLVGCDPGSGLRPFLAALFGDHDADVARAIPGEEGEVANAASVPGLIGLHAEAISSGHRTWLDLASHGLAYSSILAGTFPPPTVVLVDSLAEDLALFWGLRQEAKWLLPPWVIPVPADARADPDVPGQLKEWFQAWQRHCRCESCWVTSASVPRPTLAAFAARLQDEVKGAAITRFGVGRPTDRPPPVVAYESDQQLTVELAGRSLTFHPPRPKLLEGVSSGSWLVELRQDVRRGRAVRELCLPPRTSAFAVLNAPAPTSVPLARLPRLGDGVDGINVHCSGQKEFVRAYLPTAAEVLEEALREAGITPGDDEKRACYLPVLRMFGGLDKAAEAFSGQRGCVLKTLLGGPLTLGEIQGKARLGGGKLAELADPGFPREWLDDLDGVGKRVFEKRRRKMWTRTSPSTTAVEALLEHWADQGVLCRQWHLGPCPACKGSFWEAQIDISRPVPCPGCGRRLRLPTRVPIGYSVHRLVGHAIKEGIIPVVLAGRFLKNLTGRGFLWLPGVKFKWNGEDGDLDILACCDGHVVVGECKKIDGTPADTGFWEVILEQFAGTLEVGKACKASFAVLAAMAEGYPPGFQERVDKLAGPAMRCLLLDRQDLERGNRPLQGGADGQPRDLSLPDLIVDPIPAASRTDQAP